MTQRISLSVLTTYALPGLPLAVVLLPVTVFLPSFYVGDLGLPAATVGFAFLAIRVLDAVIDPAMGWLSDRVRTRIGRRKPWLIAGVIPTIAATWMLFAPPPGAGVAHLALWASVLTVAWTIMLVPYNAWGAELSTDYHERTRVTAVRESLIVAGTLAAMVIPAVAQAAGRATLADALRWIAVFVAVALPPFVAMAVIFVPDRAPAPTRHLPLREAIRVLGSNGPFKRLLAAFVVNSLANGLPATLFLLFVTHAFGKGESGGLLIAVYFLCGVLSVPGWTLLSRRIGKHRAWSSAMLICCGVFVCVPIAVFAEAGFPFFIGITVLTGFCLGADLVLPPAMQADVVDADSVASGEERAGLFFALWAFATKLALAAAVGLAFPLLDLAGFDAARDMQSGTALWMLVALYAFIPIALKLGAITLMWRFPLDEAQQAALRARLL